MAKDQPTYYGILPAEVRYSKIITPMAMVIYSEITALASKTGKCWATNQYFADLYEVEPTTVSEWINSLKNAGFISVTGAKSKNRKISLVNILRKKPKVKSVKAEGQPSEKAEHNNTSINTTINNIDETSFSSEDFFRNLTRSDKRVHAIIAVYALKKKMYIEKCKTSKQCWGLIAQWYKFVEKNLVQYDDKQVLTAMNACDKMVIGGRSVDWSLSAVLKELMR